MQTFHGGQHVKHTMLLDDISNLFDTALEKFDPISGQSMDSHLAELRELLSQILLFIPYDE